MQLVMFKSVSKPLMILSFQICLNNIVIHTTAMQWDRIDSFFLAHKIAPPLTEHSYSVPPKLFKIHTVQTFINSWEGLGGNGEGGRLLKIVVHLTAYRGS